jgi:hypothetical protein
MHQQQQCGNASTMHCASCSSTLAAPVLGDPTPAYFCKLGALQECLTESAVPFAVACTYLQYQPDAPGYAQLCQNIEEWEQQPSSPAGRLFYLALPPYVYPEVTRSCIL